MIAPILAYDGRQQAERATPRRDCLRQHSLGGSPFGFHMFPLGQFGVCLFCVEGRSINYMECNIHITKTGCPKAKHRLTPPLRHRHCDFSRGFWARDSDTMPSRFQKYLAVSALFAVTAAEHAFRTR